MYDHRSPISGCARVTGMDTGDARRQGPGRALTALKRLESQSGLEVFESTRDQVRRALEAAGIVFLSTDKGEGVLLQHDTVNTDKR